MSRAFWSTLPGIVSFVLACGFLSWGLAERRAIWQACRSIARELFPPAPPDNVIDINEARERARFTRVLGPADERRVYRSVQTLRASDNHSRKGFGS